jgi:hypothetical protein
MELQLSYYYIDVDDAFLLATPLEIGVHARRRKKKKKKTNNKNAVSH